MLSTATARYFASWFIVDIRIVAGSVVVEGVLPVDVAGSREVELFGIPRGSCPGWAHNL